MITKTLVAIVILLFIIACKDNSTNPDKQTNYISGETTLHTKDSSFFSFEKGSIFSAAPIKRIATYLAGPVFNLIFSMVVLSIIWSVGFTINTYSNKIVLLSDYPEIFTEGTNPADTSGILTGDKIIRINDDTIQTYSDLQKIIYSSPGKTLSIIVERNSKKINLSITPLLNKETGSGRIGVSPWIEAIVESVTGGSSAYIGGLKQGDIIKSANEITVTNYLDIYKALILKPEYLSLTVNRNGNNHNLTLVPIYEDDGSVDLGIGLKFLSLESENLSIPASILRGTAETFDTFIMTAKSLYLLFSGVDAKKAVSGPIRISYYVGEIASNSFREGIRTGFTTIFRFLSMISVALGFANLLPIPIFDGGVTKTKVQRERKKLEKIKEEERALRLAILRQIKDAIWALIMPKRG